MRSLLWKEIRQGRPLLIFSAVVALGLSAVYALTAGAMQPGASPNAGAVSGALVVVLMGLPQLLGLLAGAGLFAAEADHGTLPVLFALPLSRLRIWAVKAASGVMLTALALAVLFGVTRLAAPGLFAALASRAAWTDICFVTAITFAAGLFVTVLAPNVVGAGLAAYALLLALFIGAALLRTQLGALLLGYSEALEAELWGLLALPALLLVSARAVRRGELLQWDRSVLLQLPLLAAGLLLTVGLASGGGRLATGHSRREVHHIEAAPGVSDASAIVLLAFGRPAPYERTSTGWEPRPVGGADSSATSINSGPLYRSVAAVVLDPESGRELAVVREPLDTEKLLAAVSRDGRSAAVVTEPLGLSWGARQWPQRTQTLRLLDLKTGRRLWAGLPAPVRARKGAGLGDFAWSSDGEYLAFTAPAGRQGSGSGLYLMRRDGTLGHEVEAPSRIGSWAWSPTRQVLYLMTDRGLVEVSPGAREVKPIWKPDPSTEVGWFSLSAAGLSPDGRWIALPTAILREYRPHRALSVNAIVIVAADSGRAQTIWRSPIPLLPSVAWSPDSRMLYVLASPPDGKGDARLLRWRVGEQACTGLAASLPYAEATLAPLRDGGVLLYPERRFAQQRSLQEAPLPATVGPAIVDEAGRLRPFPDASSGRAFADANIFVTVDEQDRLITVRGAPGERTVCATDLGDGKSSRIYP